MSIVKPHFNFVNNCFRCKYCDKRYKADSTGSTANRSRHLKDAHPEKLLDNSQPRLSFAAAKIPETDINKKLVRFLCEFNIPYYTVDSHSFIEFVRALNKNAKVILTLLYFYYFAFRYQIDNNYLLFMFLTMQPKSEKLTLMLLSGKLFP